MSVMYRTCANRPLCTCALCTCAYDIMMHYGQYSFVALLYYMHPRLSLHASSFPSKCTCTCMSCLWYAFKCIIDLPLSPMISYQMQHRLCQAQPRSRRVSRAMTIQIQSEETIVKPIGLHHTLNSFETSAFRPATISCHTSEPLKILKALKVCKILQASKQPPLFGFGRPQRHRRMPPGFQSIHLPLEEDLAGDG